MNFKYEVEAVEDTKLYLRQEICHGKLGDIEFDVTTTIGVGGLSLHLSMEGRTEVINLKPLIEAWVHYDRCTSDDPSNHQGHEA